MRISVAICDDLEEERLQMARLLKNYGRRKGVAWEIELLESGAAFLDLFRPGRWDIILMDDTTQYAIQGLHLHFADFILRPVEFRHVARSMRLALERF